LIAGINDAPPPCGSALGIVLGITVGSGDGQSPLLQLVLVQPPTDGPTNGSKSTTGLNGGGVFTAPT
jgi:hypothetical protein